MSANSNPTGRDGLVVTIPATLAKRLRDGVSSGDLLARAEDLAHVSAYKPPATREQWLDDVRTKADRVRDTFELVARLENAVTDDETDATVRLEVPQLVLLLERIHKQLGWFDEELQDLRAHPGEAAMQKAEDEVEDWRALVLQLNEIEPPR